MQLRVLLPAVFLALTLVAAAPAAELGARAPMKYSCAAPEDEAVFPYGRAEDAERAVPVGSPGPVDSSPASLLGKRIRYASIKRDAGDTGILDKRIRYAAIKRDASGDTALDKRIRYASIKRDAAADPGALDKRIRYAAIKRDAEDADGLDKRMRYAAIRRGADPDVALMGRVAEANVARRAADADAET